MHCTLFSISSLSSHIWLRNPLEAIFCIFSPFGCSVCLRRKLRKCASAKEPGFLIYHVNTLLILLSFANRKSTALFQLNVLHMFCKDREWSCLWLILFSGCGLKCCTCSVLRWKVIIRSVTLRLKVMHLCCLLHVALYLRVTYCKA